MTHTRQPPPPPAQTGKLYDEPTPTPAPDSATIQLPALATDTAPTEATPAEATSAEAAPAGQPTPAPEPADLECVGLDRTLPWVYLIGGILGLLASIMLTIEKINTLADTNYTPSCNFNALISCGSVMNTPQGEAFGFANPIIGIVGFASIATIGLVLLVGASLPDWFWVGLLAGTTFGLGFIHWLAYQSVWVIGALCPYCMLVWAVTITIFCYTLLTIGTDPQFNPPNWLHRPARTLARKHPLLPSLWILTIAAVITGYFANS